MTAPLPDRTADVLAKQERIGTLLREAERDGLLVLDPAHFAWLTAGAAAKGVLQSAEHPCLYFQGQNRWLLCANIDTQRIFDEELDGLGFQLKEWPWQWGRSQLLADLVFGKKVAADQSFSDCLDLGDRIRPMRRILSAWEQTRLRELGKILAHSLEATARTLERGESEEEIAGQLTHRLVHHGLVPVSVLVSSDGRLRRHRRGGPTAHVPQDFCVLQATARRWGLHATASRIASFGPLPQDVQTEFDMACRYSAMQIGSSTAGTKVGDILLTSQRILQLGGFEHEWRLATTGWLTGFAPVEQLFASTDQPFALEVGMALTWQGSVGAVANADTILITDAGPQIVTVADQWPLKHAKLGNVTIPRPDVAVRSR